MTWDSATDALNAACLAAFGRTVTYTPQSGVAFTLTGILELGARRADAAPGTYALLFAKATAFLSPPERGDEVTVGTAIYKVVDIEADAAGGVQLVLHFNRTT